MNLVFAGRETWLVLRKPIFLGDGLKMSFLAVVDIGDFVFFGLWLFSTRMLSLVRVRMNRFTLLSFVFTLMPISFR